MIDQGIMLRILGSYMVKKTTDSKFKLIRHITSPRYGDCLLLRQLR